MNADLPPRLPTERVALRLTEPRRQEPVALLSEAAMPAMTRDATRITRSALEGAGMLRAGSGRSRLAEELRIVANQILRAARAGEPGTANLILVTSALPGEGKSFVALNLAASLAREEGQEVLLLDLGGGGNALAGRLGIAGVPGLAAPPRVTAAEAPVSGRRTEIARLHLLAAADTRACDGDAGPECGADIAPAVPLPALVRQLAQDRSDRLVIVDCPSCLSGSEASRLAGVAGQTVLVVEAERTQRATVEAALDLLQACPLVALLLNKAKLTTPHTFGAYA